MKRILTISVSLAMAMLLLASCGGGESHSFGSAWQSDGVHHWRACTDEGCEAVDGKAEHVFGSGTADVEAGEMVYSCTVCDFEKREKHEARTEVTEAEWSDALKVESFDSVLVELSMRYGEDPEDRLSIKYGADWMLEYATTADGVLRAEYSKNHDDADMGSYELASTLREAMLGKLASFSYDAESRSYVREISEPDEYGATYVISCQFADGVLVRYKQDKLNASGIHIVYDYAFSRWGEVTVESPTADVLAQIGKALSADNFKNVTASGSFGDEAVTVLIEDDKSSGNERMGKIVEAMAAAKLDDINETVFADGVLVTVTSGADASSVRIRLEGGLITGFASSGINLAFYDYGRTKDGEILEGTGGTGETPIVPK